MTAGFTANIKLHFTFNFQYFTFQLSEKVRVKRAYKDKAKNCIREDLHNRTPIKEVHEYHVTLPERHEKHHEDDVSDHYL